MSEGAVRWDGPVPDNIIENLQRGVAPHEKRVVANLANISRIMLPDKSVRIYEDFVSDWRYDRSEFVHDETCTLCGKKHIREACHIIDDVQGLDIVVGNECVYKHIEILTDGVEGLTGDAKKDYLKTQMAKAKDRFWTSKFKTDYPNARDYLEGVIKEDWMYLKEHIQYSKRALRMLDKKGYISRNTSTFKWFEAIDLKDAIAVRESMLASARTRFDDYTTKNKATGLHIINKKSFLATNFRYMAEEQVDKGWIESSSLISMTEHHIRAYGVSGLKYSSKHFYEMVIGNDRRGGPAVCKAQQILDHKPTFHSLNDWEKNFVKSCRNQFSEMGFLSERQQKLIDKFHNKVKEATV